MQTAISPNSRMFRAPLPTPDWRSVRPQVGLPAPLATG
jgi:hypothetical protein